MNVVTDAEGIRRRLEIIILLLLESGPDAARTTSAKIQRLLGFGLTQSEVAEIVGKPLNYVTAVTSMKKKARRKKEKWGNGSN